MKKQFWISLLLLIFASSTIYSAETSNAANQQIQRQADTSNVSLTIEQKQEKENIKIFSELAGQYYSNSIIQLNVNLFQFNLFENNLLDSKRYRINIPLIIYTGLSSELKKGHETSFAMVNIIAPNGGLFNFSIIPKFTIFGKKKKTEANTTFYDNNIFIGFEIQLALKIIKYQEIIEQNVKMFLNSYNSVGVSFKIPFESEHKTSKGYLSFEGHFFFCHSKKQHFYNSIGNEKDFRIGFYLNFGIIIDNAFTITIYMYYLKKDKNDLQIFQDDNLIWSISISKPF